MLNQELDELVRRMHDTIMYFAYDKISDGGKQRNAYGTLDMELINFQGGTPTGKGSATRKPNPNTVQYFDLEKKGWRSFNKENFIGILVDSV